MTDAYPSDHPPHPSIGSRIPREQPPPDQIQTLYVTPHRWTPFFRIAAGRQVIQTDQRRWDYKHQVLATRHMPPGA